MLCEISLLDFEFSMVVYCYMMKIEEMLCEDFDDFFCMIVGGNFFVCEVCKEFVDCLFEIECWFEDDEGFVESE